MAHCTCVNENLWLNCTIDETTGRSKEESGDRVEVGFILECGEDWSPSPWCNQYLAKLEYEALPCTSERNRDKCHCAFWLLQSSFQQHKLCYLMILTTCKLCIMLSWTKQTDAVSLSKAAIMAKIVGNLSEKCFSTWTTKEVGFFLVSNSIWDGIWDVQASWWSHICRSRTPVAPTKDRVLDPLTIFAPTDVSRFAVYQLPTVWPLLVLAKIS